MTIQPRRPLALSAVMLLVCSRLACAGSPRANHVFPPAGPRGGEIEVVVKGQNLADATGMLFDEPGLEMASIAKAEAGRLTAKIKVAAEARVGQHTFRVVTATGLSDLRFFFVSPFPLVAEVEPKKEEPADRAQPVALGTTVYGRTQGEDQDRFVVEAKQGQRITGEVIAAKFQTQQIYDPWLAVTREDGMPIAEVDDTAFGRQDPVVSFVAPEDGKYIFTIKESTNSGSGDCAYLLNIGVFPRPLAVYPPGGPVGTELKLQLLGDAGGLIEKTVKLPEEPTERFEVLPEMDGQLAPTPNVVRAARLPNVLEAEPNDAAAMAGAAEMPALPVAFNGIIEKPGDVDYFKFTAKKGQAYDLNVFARTLRSPLDSVIELYNEKGARLQQNDDNGAPDSYLRWSVPNDGTYFLAVKDQLSRGGPTFTYRVEVAPIVPSVAVWLPEMVNNSSQERRQIVVPKGNRYASLVRVKRNDVNGEIELEPRGLPPGVTVQAGKVDKSVDTIPMVFEAAPDASMTAGFFTVQARLTEAPKDGVPTPVSRVTHDVDVAENGNQKAFYSVREDRLPVAIIDEAPVRLIVEPPKVPLLQNGQMQLKVRAERSGDFKGPITLSLLYSPPGIGSPGTLPLKESESEAALPISASDKATVQKWKVCVVGSADFGKGPVYVSSQLFDLDVSAPFVAGQIQRTFVSQSSEAEVRVKLDQKQPFEGKARIALLGLPDGCTAEEREITKDDTEVVFKVKASSKAPVGPHKQLFCNFKLTIGGEETTASFAKGGFLRVDKAAIAKGEEAEK